MLDDASNTLVASGRPGRRAKGDVPETIRRRYYLDDRGGPGTGFYLDVQVKTPAFRDHGRQLATSRADPNVLRDMAAIARHRGWTIVEARGSSAFRREAWLAGRAAGLEVRGYRASERDLQDLDRRLERGRPHGEPRRDLAARDAQEPAVRTRMAVVDRVVRERVTNAAAQNRIIAAARARLVRWLEQGARVEPLRSSVRQAERESARQRERSR